MRALVTGATGFLGGYLIDELQRRGDEVAAVLRPSRDPSALEQRGVTPVREDLRRPSGELKTQLADVDVVYHLAAGVAGVWRGTFDVNVATTEHLVDAITEAGWSGRLVHVSSLAVYGLNQLPPGATVDEDTPVEPDPGRREDYAWGKVWQERVVARLGEGTQAELVIVRPGPIYGPERQFQYRLGRKLGEGMVLLMGGRNVIPMTYVENVASLLAECGHDERAVGQTFNCIDPEPITQWQYLRRYLSAQPGRVVVVPFPLTVARAVARALQVAERRTGGRMGPPAFFDPYVMEPSFRRLSYAPSRAQAVLGWTPPVSRDEALRRTFDAGS